MNGCVLIKLIYQYNVTSSFTNLDDMAVLIKLIYRYNSTPSSLLCYSDQRPIVNGITGYGFKYLS